MHALGETIHMPQEPYIFPWKITVDPNPLGCGDPATITIEGSPGQVASVDIDFTLTSVPGAFFTNLPSGGTLPAGQNVVTIGVTRSTSASKGCTLTAAANGVQAHTFVQPLPNDPGCDPE